MKLRVLAPTLLLLLPAACGSTSSNADIARGVLDQTLMLQIGGLVSIDFSPDGRLLAAAGMGGKVKVLRWDDRSRDPGRLFEGDTMTAYAVAFDPAGKRLFIGGKTPRVYDVGGDWAEAGQLSGHSWVYDFAFSRDGRWVATAGGQDKRVQVWNAQTLKREQLLTPHEDRTFAVAFSPNGRWLATGSKDRTVKGFDTVGGWKATGVFDKHSAAVTSLNPHPSANYVVATGATGEVLMVEWGAFALRDSLKRHSDNATCSAFSKDGRYLATGGWDGRVFLYDLRGGGTKEPIRVYESRGGRIHDVALHPDGRTVVAASDSGSLIIWRVPEAR